MDRVKSLTTNFWVSLVINPLLIKLALVCTTSWPKVHILPLMEAFVKMLILRSANIWQNALMARPTGNSGKKCYFSELSPKRFRFFFFFRDSPKWKILGKKCYFSELSFRGSVFFQVFAQLKNSREQKNVTCPNCLLRGFLLYRRVFPQGWLERLKLFTCKNKVLRISDYHKIKEPLEVEGGFVTAERPMSW